jgi:hypothetical protein
MPIPRSFAALVALPIGGCVIGDIGALDGEGMPPGGAPPGGGPNAVDCSQVQPGASPIRRMTRVEYDRTIADLLGDDSAPAQSFPAEEVALGFDNSATARGVSTVLAEHYLLAAEGVAARAVQSLDALLPCSPSADGEEACARQFLESFGRRAWRRPLDETQVTSLLGTWEAARAEGGFQGGVEAVITRMLQSPRFLYRVELEGSAVGPAAVRLDGWEMASRLSYFLWQTMPDDALFEAAANDELAKAEQVRAQAERMLADERARSVLEQFHDQWLRLGDIDTVVKSSTLFPDFGADMPPLMKAAARRFVSDVVWSEGGSADDLLTADWAFADDRLAPFYGVTAPGSDELTKVQLDPTQRSGLLTQLGFLSAAAKANQTSPIKRGVFVRVQLLCEALAPPPPDVDVTVPDPVPGQSARERFAAHTANPTCAACHTKIDPIGFGFEHYDAVGRWQSQDGDAPVDASGEVSGTSIGAFDGAVDLSQALAESDEYRSCVVKQWFRFASGRKEAGADACSIAQVEGRFEESGLAIQALVLAITGSDAFLHRAPIDP